MVNSGEHGHAADAEQQVNGHLHRAVSFTNLPGNLDGVLHAHTLGVWASGCAYEHSDRRAEDLFGACDVDRNTQVVLHPADLSDALQVGETGAAASMAKNASLVSIHLLAGCVVQHVFGNRGCDKLVFIVANLSVVGHKQTKLGVNASRDAISVGD